MTKILKKIAYIRKSLLIVEDEALKPLIFCDRVASLALDREVVNGTRYRQEPDDAIETLQAVIRAARKLSKARPG